MNTIYRAIVGGAIVLCSCSTLPADILDFEGLGLVNSSAIPQTYGDSAAVDVSYRELDGFGNAGLIDADLHFWQNDYGDLVNVIWGSVQNTSHVAEVRIDSLDSSVINLASFDVADWDNTANDQTFRVYDGSYTLLFELTNFDVDANFHDTISPNVSSQTVILQWDYPWGVAADNITFSSVPEPTSFALCLAAVPVLFRRRKRCL